MTTFADLLAPVPGISARHRLRHAEHALAQLKRWGYRLAAKTPAGPLYLVPIRGTYIAPSAALLYRVHHDALLVWVTRKAECRALVHWRARRRSAPFGSLRES